MRAFPDTLKYIFFAEINTTSKGCSDADMFIFHRTEEVQRKQVLFLSTLYMRHPYLLLRDPIGHIHSLFWVESLTISSSSHRPWRLIIVPLRSTRLPSSVPNFRRSISFVPNTTLKNSSVSIRLLNITYR